MGHFLKHLHNTMRQKGSVLVLLSATLMINANAQWHQQGPKLVGTGATSIVAEQGRSVSISSDGNTAIVGGFQDESNKGAAWIFIRSNGVWIQQGPKLVGTGAVGPSQQGFSASISSDGNTAIVGGRADNSGIGAVWIFTRNGIVWSQQGPKLVGTGAVSNGAQGQSVSISSDGNTAIVGAHGDNLVTGAAWVFTRSGGVWSQQGPKLVGTGAVGNGAQGFSVSISSDGNTAIVGGVFDNNEFGAAWIFTRGAGVWTQQGPKLVGTGVGGTLPPHQGCSVSISSDGNTAIVGGNADNDNIGAAWVFTRTGGVWTQQGAKLVGTGGIATPGQGTSVSISSGGSTAIVGGPGDNTGQGAAWIFTRSGGAWTQQGSKLVGTGAIVRPLQGSSVSISSSGSTAIVGGPGDNTHAGAAWVFEKLSITRPQAGERWIAGDQDTIRWVGGTANQFLNIEFSVDSGTTYTLIDFAIPADSGKYLWTVPDSLSTRAKIRLSDVFTSDSLAVSDTFRVKGYRLTRIDANGHYERFSPPKHGWSFVNADSNFWPTTWYNQFQYTGGIDRHTGEPYDEMFPTAPIFALPHHFVDWPVFVDVFGRSSCYWGSTNIYREASIERWKDEKTGFNGSCFGIAQSALLYFHYPQEFHQRHPSIPLADSLSSIRPMNDAIRLTINRYFGMQYGKLKRDHDANNASTTPRQTLQAIRQAWSNDDPSDDAGLRFYDPAGSGGHAVIPYRLQRSTTIPTQFQLFVCNSNNPPSFGDFILIDSLNNTWQEFTGFGWGQGSSLMHLYPPAVGFFLPSIFPSSSSSGRIEASGSARREVWSPWRSDVRIFAPGGDSIGVINGNAFNSVPNASTIAFETGHPQPPLGYDLPTGSYRVRVTNPVDTIISLSFRTDSLSITYSRGGASTGHRDELRYDDRLSVKNSDSEQKSINLQVLAAGATRDRTANITGLALLQNDSLSAGMDAQYRPTLSNFGPAKSYRLGLQNSSVLGLRRFTGGTLTIPTQCGHIIEPNWDSLATTVRIYVDLGNNGTIDDTLVVSNTVDVDDRGSLGLPTEYNLTQNYPNPFNPSTRIEYSLPSSGHVTVRVYSVLGQQIASLVNEEQSRGVHSIVWNGTSDVGVQAGSGVYFYRVEIHASNGATSFAGVRKMVLLK